MSCRQKIKYERSEYFTWQFNEKPEVLSCIITKEVTLLEVTYRQAGDYLLPELELRSEETRIIGKYGMLRRTYLSKWPLKQRACQDKHLADVDEQATIRFEQIVKQMKKAEGVTEELKNENQFVWVQKMNNIQARAMEIIGEELIFV